MPAPTIAIFGALARFNYGDLLFPLILEKAIRKQSPDARVEAIGLRSSDLSRFGALPTKAVRWLNEPDHLPDGSSLILAGGEMLGADWTRLTSHLLPQRFGDSLFKIAQRLLSEERLEKAARNWVKGSWDVPFAPRPQHFQNQVRIIFNAVGGSGLTNQPHAWQQAVREAIDEASFASVRDQKTLDILDMTSGAPLPLGEQTSGAYLYPDSAATMARLFNKNELKQSATGKAAEILRDGKPYLCFQLHRYFKPKKLEAFARQLDEVHRDLGLRIVLLPIGRAAGHSDQVALEAVRKSMSASADLPTEIGVFEIMALLAHSAAYTGTSLHGLITAMAFARPYAVLGKNPKCLAFANSWAPEDLRPPLQAKTFAQQLAQRLDTSQSVLDATALNLANQAQQGVDRVVEAALS